MSKTVLFFGFFFWCHLAVSAEPRDEWNEWVKKLSHDEFVVREQAKEQLIELGKKDLDRTMEESLDLYRTSKDPEVKSYAHDILYTLFALREQRKKENEPSLGIFLTHKYDLKNKFLAKGGAALAAARGTKKFLRFEVSHVSNEKLKSVLRQGDEIIKIGELDLKDNPQAIDRRRNHKYLDYIRSLTVGEEVTLIMKREEEVKNIKVMVEKVKDVESDLPVHVKESLKEPQQNVFGRIHVGGGGQSMTSSRSVREKFENWLEKEQEK